MPANPFWPFILCCVMPALFLATGLIAFCVGTSARGQAWIRGERHPLADDRQRGFAVTPRGRSGI